MNPSDVARRKHIIAVARGEAPAELVLRDARYLNVFTNEWCEGDIAITEGKIAGVGGQYTGEQVVEAAGKWVVPAFMDSHIHLESAIVTPREFARIALAHGTAVVVADPHEIANVLGTDGIRYLLQATEDIGLDVRVMLPSCVPATPFDENAGTIAASDLEPFYAHPRVLGLAEMMDYVGAYQNDATIAKIVAAHQHGKPIDGHAPALSGRVLDGYIAAGIYSDHECDSFENALEKLRKGQYIMIREGTAARNLSALMPLLQNSNWAQRCLFATDDKHPNDLLAQGHIDGIVRTCIQQGIDPILALKSASYNAAQYFSLREKGAIAGGYDADLLLLDNLQTVSIHSVWCGGQLRATQGKTLPIPQPHIDAALLAKAHNTMHATPIQVSDLACGTAPVIGLVAGELRTTDCGTADAIAPTQDMLKVVVLERHHNTGHLGVAYLKGYGLQAGAVATSIGHDSHNIVAVGANDVDLCAAVNRVIAAQGGIYVVHGAECIGLPLEIGGIMTESSVEAVDHALSAAIEAAHTLGVRREIDPFMPLSFLSLPVIPVLRILPGGVFDVNTFSYRF